MPATFALKFISGKYQGGEFPLPEKAEIIVGRGSDVGIVLVEDMVSRRHARIIVNGNRLGIIDLGSTNGTFVNGEKISKVELKAGDRVLVGTSILKVVGAGELSTQGSKLAGDELRTMMESIAKAREGQESSMSGELEEVPFPDLMQLFASNKKSGVVMFTGAHTGSVFLKEGHLMFAQIGDKKLPPAKTFARMVHWDRGHFELKPLGDAAFPETITQSTESLLLEALRQFDEMKRIQKDIPAQAAKLSVVRPLKGKLRDLKPEELDALQLFLSAPDFGAALEEFPGFDYDAILAARKLIKEGFLTAG